jgi:nicotinamide-nucleotide amidase
MKPLRLVAGCAPEAFGAGLYPARPPGAQLPIGAAQSLKQSEACGAGGLRRSSTRALSLGLLSSWLLLTGWTAAPPAASAPEAEHQLTYAIIVTGGELLEGAYPDSHTHFLTRTLTPLGVRCVGSITVDDDRSAIQSALHFATNRARLVIVTGGLGPTPNDITRETISEFTGIALAEHSEVIAGMERRFGQTREQLRPNLRRQAQTPVRGAYLPNTTGTAVGLVFDLSPVVIFALPGPPRELQPMVRSALVPFLQERFGARKPGASVTLRFVGVGQSQIDQTIREQVTVPPDVVVTSLFEGGRVDFTFSLPSDSASDRDRLERIKQAVRASLDDYVYGEGTATLEQHVLQRLRLRHGTLMVAEIASHGQIAASLEEAEGADEVLLAACSAPTPFALAGFLRLLPPGGGIQFRGEVGVQEFARSLSTARPGHAVLVIGPVETSGSARSVWAAFGGADASQTLRIQTKQLSVPASGEIPRGQLTTQVLDWLRRLLR